MTIELHLSGAAAEAVRVTVPQLVAELVASSITAQDPALWGPDAEAEASKRLGWTEAVAISRPLVDEILALREDLAARGVNRVVLAGMGGSSLAPEVITRTQGVPLTVLDSTSPGQVAAALADGLTESVLVVSSKSGSTVETDSQRRAYEAAFTAAGIDPSERIIVVTDPGSPLDGEARERGYRVFNADPNVGGRYSALTAFGLVPSGLAGADIAQLLDEAEQAMLAVSVDQPSNPALQLGAAIAATEPRRDKLAIVADGTHIVGFADWAEQLIAESTGKLGTGILPVVIDPLSTEIAAGYADVQVVRLVDDASATHLFANDRHEGEILISGSLGAMLIVWEYAVVIAGRLLGINPFDQPDVESAKTAARGLLDARPEPAPAAFTDAGIEVRATPELVTAMAGRESLAGAMEALIESLGADGYLSVHAYVDRSSVPQLEGIRNLLAARAGRPVTFGWAPRFLHSTGQYHKGGPANGVFLQITEQGGADLEVPDRPFTFGELIRAQAQGDAAVLAEHGRPVLTLNLTDTEQNIVALFEAAN